MTDIDELEINQRGKWRNIHVSLPVKQMKTNKIQNSQKDWKKNVLMSSCKLKTWSHNAFNLI